MNAHPVPHLFFIIVDLHDLLLAYFYSTFLLLLSLKKVPKYLYTLLKCNSLWKTKKFYLPFMQFIAARQFLSG